VPSQIHDCRERLRSLLERHEITRGLYVRIHGKHLILGRQEPPFGPEQEPQDDDRVRLTHLGGHRFALSVKRHTERWERTPYSGSLEEMVEIMTATMQHLLAAWP